MKKIVFIDLYENNHISTPSTRVVGNAPNNVDIDFNNINGFRIVTTEEENIDVHRLIKKMKLIDNDELVFESYNCEQEVYINAPLYKYDNLTETEKNLVKRIYGKYAKICSFYILKNEDGKIHDLITSNDYTHQINSNDELGKILQYKLNEYSNGKTK